MPLLHENLCSVVLHPPPPLRVGTEKLLVTSKLSAPHDGNEHQIILKSMRDFTQESSERGLVCERVVFMQKGLMIPGESSDGGGIKSRR